MSSVRQRVCSDVLVETANDRHPGFGYNSYSRQFYRLSIHGARASLVDVVKANGISVNFGYPDEPDICRLWLPYWISDSQTFLNLCRIITSSGFVPAAEVDVSEMKLVDASNTSVLFGLGHGRKNWTKSIKESDSRDIELLLVALGVD